MGYCALYNYIHPRLVSLVGHFVGYRSMRRVSFGMSSVNYGSVKSILFLSISIAISSILFAIDLTLAHVMFGKSYELFCSILVSTFWRHRPICWPILCTFLSALVFCFEILHLNIYLNERTLTSVCQWIYRNQFQGQGQYATTCMTLIYICQIYLPI